MQTLSAEQFKTKYGVAPTQVFKEQPKPEPGYFSRVGTEIGQNLAGAKEAITYGADLVSKSQISGNPLDQARGEIRAGLGTAGAAVRIGLSPITQAIAPLITAGIKSTGVLDNQKVQSTLKGIDEWAKAHPEAAANLKDIFDIATVAVGGAGTKAITPTIEKGITGTVETAGKVSEGIMGAIKPVIQGAEGVTKMATEGLSRLPSRISTNIAEKQATEATIRSLPTKIAQTAARDGIDIADIKFVSQVPKEQKNILKYLADTASKYAKGETKTNPIELVGQPIVNRIKELEKAKNVIGKQLGEVAQNLGTVRTQEIAPTVIEQLKKVPGLSGIKVDKKGILDFKDTTLSSSLTSADRKAIQNAFMTSIKSGTGLSKHKFRQELFEILGGQKKSLANITDTQEKALEAIRSGLATVLENKNSSYKTLSKEFAIKAQPLQDLRKLMKTIPGATEDIANMQAGLLARRLTSTAVSGPQLAAILKRIDEATKVVGKARISTENMQNMYNILNKYYDLAPKTGFQGQVKAGVESATGAADFLVKQIKGLAGETTAVRQKALENLLKDALK